MYCYKCGKELQDRAIFCSYCGTNQNESGASYSSSAVNHENKENTENRPKERHGFVTFWLVFGICFGIYGLIDSFSGSTNSFYNVLKLFNLMSDIQRTFLTIQSIVYIVSYFLLLNWKKIGFWLIVGTDALSAFILSGSGGGILLWLVFLAIKDVFLFGILSIRKNGISCWEQLTYLNPEELSSGEFNRRYGESIYVAITDTAIRNNPHHDAFIEKTLKAGDKIYSKNIFTVEQNWYYVRSEDSKNGWCFSRHFEKC